jgi:starch-binding outer membrane protein, SusD/RagB family
MRKIGTIVIAAAVLSVGACSFEVTNPGPIDNDLLDDPGAWTALARGVLFNISRAVGIDAFYAAVVSKEYGTSGRVNATKLPLVFGQLTPDDMSQNAWNWSQGARWQAEDGARRIQRVLGAGAANNRFNGQFLMYAALSNRILAENFCEAVIDGGARQPHTAYLTRGDSLATQAIAVAGAAGDGTTRDAARAIRASIRLYRGDFAGAAADAALVPTALKVVAPFDAATHNLIVEENDAAIGGQFRAHTVWRTYFENYYRVTGDPRVAWDSSTTQRFGEFSNIIWYRQQKYSSITGGYGSPINLVSGREARLIEAEVRLRANDIPGAMAKLDTLRTSIKSNGGTAVALGAPLPTYPVPANANEAWMNLFHERRIELWLEARSMGDVRRWVADGTYGTLIVPGTYGNNGPAANATTTASENVADRVRLCMPMTRGERQTNANLPLTIDDPVSPIFVAGTVAPW